MPQTAVQNLNLIVTMANGSLKVQGPVIPGNTASFDAMLPLTLLLYGTFSQEGSEVWWLFFLEHFT